MSQLHDASPRPTARPTHGEAPTVDGANTDAPPTAEGGCGCGGCGCGGGGAETITIEASPSD